MRFSACVLLLLSLTAVPGFAQTNDLVAANVQVISGVGDFGQPIVEAVGQIANTSPDTAYTNISLTADAYDADGARLGEGMGVLTNACGVGLLPNFSLQPGLAQTFSAPLELSDPAATVDHVEVSIDAQPTDPAPAAALTKAIRRVTADETIDVEWINNHSLRYATGCSDDLFMQWTWYNYNTQVEAKTPIAAPHAADVTDAMRQRLLLTDDAEFAHSMLRYAPGGNRLVYQNKRNDFLTAYLDGTYRRGIYNDLNSRSLQGIYWLPDEKFLAYYYGAYGDPVYYFTADAEARVISPPLAKNPPSITAPGVSSDGRRVVVSGDFNDQGLGYYLYVVTNGFFQKLFVAAPPGNNYPAPIPLADPTSNLINRVYAALPIKDEPRLVCFNRDEGKLHDLAPLPLDLSDVAHAWWWISPNATQIALAANGVHGGLWLIDLSALLSCHA